ncbi:MAG: enhanced serine sensitivity protein SseB [Saccharofermentans sp.]|nr:enhanced serine sensitivity protein SseB [Saccharofermentans sp.]
MENDFFLRERIENPRLLELMRLVRKERTSQNMLDVLSEATGCRFIVPVEIINDTFSLQAVGDKNGRRFMVAFSDSDSFDINKKSDDQKAVASSFADLIDAACQENLGLDGLILNPGAEEIILGKDMLKDILKNMAPDNTVQIGDPDRYPVDMKKMIVEFCSNEPKISKAYVRFFQNSDASSKGWLFILACDAPENERNYIFDTFNRFMKPYCDGLECFTAGADEEYAKNAAEGAKPVYERA